MAPERKEIREALLATLRGLTKDQPERDWMTWVAMQVTPHISAAWQHAFDNVTPDAALAFATTGIGFTVYGVPLAEDSALLDTGLDLALGPRTKADVSYTAQIAHHVHDNGIKGELSVLF